jgi:hypothetical protein
MKLYCGDYDSNNYKGQQSVCSLSITWSFYVISTSHWHAATQLVINRITNHTATESVYVNFRYIALWTIPMPQLISVCRSLPTIVLVPGSSSGFQTENNLLKLSLQIVWSSQIVVNCRLQSLSCISISRASIVSNPVHDSPILRRYRR